jgi:hypothetical protein
MGEFASEGGEDEEEDEEVLETHRETRQRTAARSKLAAGTRQLNNTAFYTSLSSGGPASAMPAPWPKRQKIGCARANKHAWLHF